MNELLAINGSCRIKLEAPLLGMQKETIKRLLLVNKIDIKQTFSGYGKENN